jgi:methyltransferase family protein
MEPDELRGYDPGYWGHSLANAAEIVLPFLDAAGARSVVEVGAYAGDLTRELLDWAAASGARVAAIDPTPADELVELAAARADLELVREPSHEALGRIAVADAYVIDGDHNYYTVSEELRLIDEAAKLTGPLLILHDVRWPHARRDTYYAPERIPDEHRQPMVEGAGVLPWDDGISGYGIPYKWAAAREGGPRNGVLTAVEDFVAAREWMVLAVIPVFFGVGIAWHREAPWAEAVERLARDWDRNPVLERIEANRVHHLASAHAERINAAEVEPLRARVRQLEALLRAMAGSGAVRWADRLSRLRHPRSPGAWRRRIGRALGDERESNPPGR